VEVYKPSHGALLAYGRLSVAATKLITPIAPHVEDNMDVVVCRGLLLPLAWHWWQ